MKQQQILLKQRPNGVPNNDTFAFWEVDVPEPAADEVLVKTLFVSVDPYMRGRMSSAPSYAEPFEVGKPPKGGIVAEVVKSNEPSLEKGDIVTARLAWQEYNVVKFQDVRKVDPQGAPISTALGVLGMPGLTAYFGMYDIGNPKEGETVVVSGAAGAVGSVAGQLAKKRGAKVVGIVGSNEKANRIINKFGFDQAVNYKDGDVSTQLEKVCPEGIDVYYENVGGEIGDAVWPLLNTFARVPVCGSISSYNLAEGEEDIGKRVQRFLVKSRVRMQGFLVGDYAERFHEAYPELARFVRDGSLAYDETIREGFQEIPAAFLGLFAGENIGKQIVKVADASQKN